MTIIEAYQVLHKFLLGSLNLLSLDQNMSFIQVIYNKMYVYTCIYHENVILICQALHHIDSIYPLYSHYLPHKFVYFQPSDDCWFKCNNGKDALMLSKNYPLQKDSTLQEIRWYQWENIVNSTGKT